MDRILTNAEKKKRFTFDTLDLFPYTLALIMIGGEIYILHQFVEVSRLLHLF